MDPISHVLFGRVLIALDRRQRLGPHTVAACLLGSIAPDMDGIVAFFRWDLYLRVHQGGTHSLLGSLAIAMAVAAVVHVFTRDGHFSLLVAASWIGALSHLAFDLFSGASLRLAWPLFGLQLSVPLVAMADPWLVTICIAGALTLWVRRRKMAKTALGVVLVIAAFLALKGALMIIALSHWNTARGSEPIISHAVEAEWGSLTEWNVFDRTSHALRRWGVNASNKNSTLLFSLALPPDSSIVAASMSLDTVRNFLSVHQLGFAVVMPLENGTTRVLWSDVRYCWPSTATVKAAAPLDCALWFGGILDGERRPVMQIVRVGRWLQTRPIGP